MDNRISAGWEMGSAMFTRATITSVLLAALALGGCGTLREAMTPEPARPAVTTADMPGQLEPIHAAAFTRDLAVFWVSSNGCTRKDDVRPVVTQTRDSAVITLRRIDEDKCTRPMAEGIQLEWTFEELGLAPGASVSVNNPYLMPHTS